MAQQHWTESPAGACAPGSAFVRRAEGIGLHRWPLGPAEQPGAPAAAAAGRDFDFLVGEWIVANRCLPEPCTGAGEWRSFHTIHSCRPLLDGFGVVEEIADDAGQTSVVLRFFDRETERWAVYRMSAADTAIRVPLRGRFDGDVGSFTGEDRSGARATLVRELWSQAAAGQPHWEQARSTDGGTTWQTTWLRDFRRVAW